MEKNNLIDHLQKEGYLKNEHVIKAMKRIPRELFVPEQYQKMAYLDTPLNIGYGQTISAPHMVALMLETLNLKDNSKVLEIGTGTGYHAAIAATIAYFGTVFTIERIPQLLSQAQNNFSKLKLSNIIACLGDGSVGLPEHSPFTHIYATCMAPKVPPALLNQLAEGGKMIIPVNGSYCSLIQIEKHGNTISRNNVCKCSFVPMIGIEAYHED